MVDDKQGKPHSMRDDQLNIMLFSEFLKAQRRNEQQEATIAELRQQIAVFTRGSAKVSARLELSRRVVRTVLNYQ